MDLVILIDDFVGFLTSPRWMLG